MKRILAVLLGIATCVSYGTVTEIKLIEPNLELVTVASIPVTEINTNSVEVTTVAIQDVDLTELNTALENRVNTYSSFMFKPRLNFEQNEQAWADMLGQYKTIEPITYIPADTNLKMITEVSLPTSAVEYTTVYAELTAYKEQGYNTVLLAIDGREDVYTLKYFIKRINEHGLDVYFTFGGYEERTLNLPPPKQYVNYLRILAPLCKGFLMNWRQTSCHTFYITDEWNNMNMSLLREYNPNIIILGEVHYGYNVDNNGSYGFTYNVPENISGVILVNFGYNGINIEGVVKRLIPKKIGNDIPLVGVVAEGDISVIEGRFSKAGAGVITLSEPGFQQSSINQKEE